MGMFSIILQQMLTMFTLILFGYLLVKAKVINSEGARQISTILSMYVMPSSMIASFRANYDAGRMRLFLWAIAAAFLTIGARILLNYFVFKQEERIDKYAATFPNSGFFGIPIVTSLIGIEGVFFMTAYIMVNNITQWTYGQYLISGDAKAMTPVKAILNPGMIGALIGLTLYLTQLPLPTFIWNSVESLAALNTSLAMIIIGSYLANSNVSELFEHKRAYLVAFLRLIVTPVLSIFIIFALPIDNLEVELVLTIASIAPAAVNTAILGRLFGGDYEYGARLVVLTSLFSLLTIPFMMQLAQVLFT